MRVAGTPMSLMERMMSSAWRRAVVWAICTEAAVPRVGETATTWKLAPGQVLQRLIQRGIEDLLIVHIGMVEAHHHQGRAGGCHLEHAAAAQRTGDAAAIEDRHS